jgi:hypothetical protein
MRRSYLALIAVTFGLLTLACSGGGSSLVGPGAVTDSGQISAQATGAGSSVQTDATVGTPVACQVRPIESTHGELDPIQ